MSKPRYKAFISYRHVEPDRAIAKWLHKSLETYRVPKDLQKKGLPKTPGRVFRDEEELPASSDLSNEINSALESSEFLIVVCSPRVVESIWCDAEVKKFKDMGLHDKIIALLIEGEPKDSFLPSLCEIRKHVIKGDGTKIEEIEAIEPLAADIRPRKDQSQKELKHLAKLRILACLLGCKFDDLRKREIKRKQRFLIQVATFLVFLIILLSGLTFWALKEQNIANEQRKIAENQKVKADQKTIEANQAHQKTIEEKKRTERLKKASQLREAKHIWLEKFEKAKVEKLSPDKFFYAARALGFKGFGYEELPHDKKKLLDEEYPQLFDFDENFELYNRLNYKENFILPIWASGSSSHHEKLIKSVVYSKDGQLVASSSDDKTIKLWNVKTGQLLRTLRGHEFKVRSVCFSPNGKLLASAGKVIKLWEVQTGRLLTEIMGHSGSVSSVVFSPDGSVLASSSEDKTIKLWDVSSGKERGNLNGHFSPVTSISFGAKGNILVSGAKNKTVNLWDLQSGSILKSFIGHRSVINTVSLSPDDNKLVSASTNSVKIWDVVLGQELRTFPIRNLRSIAVNWINNTFVTASWNGAISLRSLDDGKEIRLIKPKNGSIINQLSLSSDGNFLVNTASNRIEIRNINNGEQGQEHNSHDGWINSVDFSPDGKLFASASSDFTAKLRSMKTGELLKSFMHQGNVLCVKFSPDGKFLATSGFDRVINVWDLQSLELKLSHQGQVYAHSVTFSPDSKLLAICTLNGELKLWDIEKNSIVQSRDLVISNGDICFSPDGKYLIHSYGKDIRVWDMKKMSVKAIFKGHNSLVKSLSICPKGKTFASASEKTIRIWDLETGYLGVEKKTESKFNSLDFSPDGETLISGCEDNRIQIWSIENLELKDNINNSSPTLSVKFSPDGKSILSGSKDGIVRVWGMDSGFITSKKLIHHSSVIDMLFSEDSETLACSYSDGTFRFYSSLTGSLKGFYPFSSLIISMDFDKKEQLFAAGLLNGLIKVLKNKEVVTLSGHKASVNSVSFNFDGTLLASASADKTLKIWDLKSEKTIAEFKGHSNTIYSVDFTSDSKYLISTSKDNTTKVWDIKTGEVITSIPHYYERIKTSPDGKYFIGSIGSTLSIYDFENGALIKSFKISNKRAFTFSPEGNILVFEFNGLIQFWDIENKKKLMNISVRKNAQSIKMNFRTNELIIAYQNEIRRINVEAFVDLASYFVGNDYSFDEQEDISYNKLNETLYHKRKIFINISKNSHISILQNSKTTEEANRKLFYHYKRNKALKASMLLLKQPMDQEIPKEDKDYVLNNWNILFK